MKITRPDGSEAEFDGMNDSIPVRVFPGGEVDFFPDEYQDGPKLLKQFKERLLTRRKISLERMKPFGRSVKYVTIPLYAHGDMIPFSDMGEIYFTADEDGEKPLSYDVTSPGTIHCCYYIFKVSGGKFWVWEPKKESDHE